MKNTSKKWITWMCMGVMIAVLCGSIAWADFFVVGAGKKAKKTVLVSPKSTETESGTALLNALNDITDAGETNSYLVIIEPGVYDIGSNSLDMKEYVDIQGSGEKVTKITGAIDSNVKGILNGANNAEVRFLTVENTGSGDYTIGIYCDPASPSLTHVTAIVSGGFNCYGIVIWNASPSLTNVTAISTGGGGDLSIGISLQASSSTLTNVAANGSGATTNYGIVAGNSSSPTMTVVQAKATGGDFATGVQFQVSSSIVTNLTAKASGAATKNYGIRNYNSSNLKIDDSVITGSDAAASATEGYVTYFGCTKLDGGVSGQGSFVCVHCYDSSYNALSANCLPLP